MFHAAPPVGELRWKEPQPAVPWEGVKEADTYGDASRRQHGDGYREGFAYEPEMNGGEGWASLGVILFQVTYQLGSLGFFSHPLLSAESPNGVSGNFGLFDLVAALKWIRNNIEQVSGDPANITISGQSDGNDRWSPCTAGSPLFMILDVDVEEATFTIADKPEYRMEVFRDKI